MDTDYQYSERELMLIRAVGFEGLIGRVDPLSIYRGMMERAFLDQLPTPVCESIRRCLQAFVTVPQQVKRGTEEWDRLIDLEPDNQMTTGQWLERLERYRERLHREIRDELARENYGKSYEGAIEIHFPSIHESEFAITVHCYVLGPARHYRHEGASLDQCLEKAERDLDRWVEQARVEREFTESID